MRLTSKGQVTIPQALRERFGMLPRTEVSFEALTDGILVRVDRAERTRRVEAAIARSRGSATANRSTAEIMKLTRGED